MRLQQGVVWWSSDISMTLIILMCHSKPHMYCIEPREEIHLFKKINVTFSNTFPRSFRTSEAFWQRCFQSKQNIPAALSYFFFPFFCLKIGLQHQHACWFCYNHVSNNQPLKGSSFPRLKQYSDSNNIDITPWPLPGEWSAVMATLRWRGARVNRFGESYRWCFSDTSSNKW